MRNFLLLTTLLIVTYCNSQIVNTESSRMQTDTTGWIGGFGTAFSITQNTSKIIGMDAEAHVQYKTTNDRGLWLFLTNFNFLKVGSRESIRNYFAHLRYNFKVNLWLRWEFFTQYQDNAITSIDPRLLLGTGPRFKIISIEKFRLYAAVLLMYEMEREKTTPKIIHHDWRNSSYISFTWLPNKATELISTTYFQPRLDKFSDYRILNQAVFRVKATPHFSMSAKWSYLHDRFPAGTSPRTTYSFATGVDYDFGPLKRPASRGRR